MAIGAARDDGGIACRAAWDGAVVHHSGAVYPCTQICRRGCTDSLKLGDLADGSLNEVLHGEVARDLRRRLGAGDIDGLCCSHCDKVGTCNTYSDPLSARATADGDEGARYSGVEPGPIRRLELGITDLCNLRCPMCALARDEHNPPGLPVRGFLPVERALDCIADAEHGLPDDGHVNVWLHWIGEPLLHPDFSAIVQRLREAGDRFHLHLVTNGVALDDATTELLLSLRGKHWLSVSLNALTEETYLEVNGADRRAQAYAGITRFLDARARRGKESVWGVVATTVVLEENRDEIPDFVRYWRSEFSRRGEASEIALNGKPGRTATQVMLLREVDRPDSESIFRETLRRLGHHDAAWPLRSWAVVDEFVLTPSVDLKVRGDLLRAALKDLRSGLCPDEDGRCSLALLDSIARNTDAKTVAEEVSLVLQWLAEADEPLSCSRRGRLTSLLGDLDEKGVSLGVSVAPAVLRLARLQGALDLDLALVAVVPSAGADLLDAVLSRLAVAPNSAVQTWQMHRLWQLATELPWVERSVPSAVLERSLERTPESCIDRWLLLAALGPEERCSRALDALAEGAGLSDWTPDRLTMLAGILDLNEALPSPILVNSECVTRLEGLYVAAAGPDQAAASRAMERAHPLFADAPQWLRTAFLRRFGLEVDPMPLGCSPRSGELT